MSLQAPRPYAATITTGNSLSSKIDVGGGFLYVAVGVPTNTNAFQASGGSPVWVQGSWDGTNFYRFYEVYTQTVTNPFQIASSVCNAVVSVPYFNFRYMKLEISGTVTGAGGTVPYEIICTDSL
jgi:hypothetical protein